MVAVPVVVITVGSYTFVVVAVAAAAVAVAAVAVAAVGLILLLYFSRLSVAALVSSICLPELCKRWYQRAFIQCIYLRAQKENSNSNKLQSPRNQSKGLD